MDIGFFVSGEVMLVLGILVFMMLWHLVPAGRGSWLLRSEIITNIILAVLTISLPLAILLVWAGVFAAHWSFPAELLVSLAMTSAGILAGSIASKLLWRGLSRPG